MPRGTIEYVCTRSWVRLSAVSARRADASGADGEGT